MRINIFSVHDHFIFYNHLTNTKYANNNLCGLKLNENKILIKYITMTDCKLNSEEYLDNIRYVINNVDLPKLPKYFDINSDYSINKEIALRYNLSDYSKVHKKFNELIFGGGLNDSSDVKSDQEMNIKMKETFYIQIKKDILNSSRLSNLIDICISGRNVKDNLLYEMTKKFMMDIRDCFKCVVIQNDNMTLNVFTNLPQPINDIIARYIIDYSFYFVINNKSPEVVKWYYRIIKPSKVDLIDYNYNLYDYNNCDYNWKNEEDSLEMAEWIYETFKLTKIDMYRIKTYRLYDLCLRGYMKVIKWTITEFKINRGDFDAYSHIKKAFFAACSHNHLEVAKYMARIFEITRKDCIDDDDDYCYTTFCTICERGYLEVVEWSVLKFKMTKKECMGGYLYAKKFERVAVVKWLEENLKIDA
jgi:hypothetical protein